ncbi:hypothetical protein [Nocardioides mangrovi]|uniref:Uncharacterized protein n=1 Tax=Nocardioides mangrovi TaxID=2874580 RepID=A0ABS7U8X4_9ACTN|nr:hypothetical protein [Nocardioides mangrovi]MBZ5737401.1 hypothetical protein [Nocardioides mangrovi]
MNAVKKVAVAAVVALSLLGVTQAVSPASAADSSKVTTAGGNHWCC